MHGAEGVEITIGFWAAATRVMMVSNWPEPPRRVFHAEAKRRAFDGWQTSVSSNGYCVGSDLKIGFTRRAPFHHLGGKIEVLMRPEVSHCSSAKGMVTAALVAAISQQPTVSRTLVNGTVSAG